MNVAIIPARGGSKRIPRKNIREFHGRPMIAWPLQAARLSGCFDRIIVSTDDEEIAQVAMREGGEVPFIRPPSLSGDHVGTAAVVAHAIHELRSQGHDPREVCCIYATSPFLQPADLQEGLKVLRANRVDFAFSVTSFPYPIQRALRLTDNGRIAMFFPGNEQSRSQDLEHSYHDAGQFYWGTADAWIEGRPVFGEASVPVYLPRHRVQDIDTEEDWVRASTLFRLLAMGQ